jgi:sec-independent protein translocase protein TatC
MSSEDERRDLSKNDEEPSGSVDQPEGAGTPVPSPPHDEHPNSETSGLEPSSTYIEPSYDPDNYEDPYGYHADTETGSQAGGAVLPPPYEPPPPPPAPVIRPPEPEPDPEEEEEGMLRMSFLEHLEELRKRLIYAIGGLGVAFMVSLTFSEALWMIVQEPATVALASLGYKDIGLVFTSPMDSFSIIYVKLPLLTAMFLASPWVLYQIWAFVAPGLYPRERRFAAPFVISSASLFVMGGCFAYFVAFRFGLTFLLGIGRDVNVRPMITITEYFDIFTNVILGIAVVFELPILIFFLTLLRIASPKFLIQNARYAVLLIVMLAAVVTPTPDIINLMLFSVPMVLLYFVGVFASYLLVLSRENRRFPWRTFLIVIGIPLLLAAVGVYFAIYRYGYHVSGGWPFLVR